MAYPPRQQAPPNENDTFGETGAWLPEIIPNPGLNVHHHDIIHFDMDPRNIFISDTDADHRGMPLFKISDFGLAHTVNDTRGTDQGPPYSIAEKYEIWNVRQIGKDGYHLPEQFTSDWDKLRQNADPFSQDLNNNPPGPISTIGDLNTVAANYGEWSNVWQVGLTVWCCMTNLNPLHPPIATQDPANQNNWTYGISIMDPQYTAIYGNELCRLVSQCLMHKPADRPTLQQIRASLDNVIQPPVLTNADRAWIRKYLRLPSIPRERPVDAAFG
ncbi:hypothetical protein diail_9045 [Diaporthe ilicicola]|nr:hypothetical protein diail_9045 [Diaporthe ilicicola]